MAHILKNNNLEIQIDLPLEKYNFSRFDWTGKIVSVKFQNKLVSGHEKIDFMKFKNSGSGFCNEFGIDSALGFEEAEIGGWFHKIGIGLLKKEDSQYFFHKNYEIKPCEFSSSTEPNKIIISCTSELVNDYSYLLKKEIELLESGFSIKYKLENTGQKTIKTEEYNHNFSAIDKEEMGSNYLLDFPFQIKPEQFIETVNPEGKVAIGKNEITFNGPIKEDFFFSNLNGGENVDANWKLTNLKSKITLSETGSFKTNKVNLWGSRHVISPELFFDILVDSGQTIAWSRTYEIYLID